MKLSIRLTTLAFTAVALAGTIGAQQRPGGHGSAHSQAPRGHAGNGARHEVRVQHYAPSRGERGDVRGRDSYQARGDFRGRTGPAPRADLRGRNIPAARNDFRGREDYRVPVATHGRPLITRGYAPVGGFGRAGVYARGPRFGAVGGFGLRAGLPLGWESRVVFHGFFPLEYASYCQPVPQSYDYLLPAMAPSYDPCMFGDRVVVYDRFSRSIVFVAMT